MVMKNFTRNFKQLLKKRVIVAVPRKEVTWVFLREVSRIVEGND